MKQSDIFFSQVNVSFQFKRLCLTFRLYIPINLLVEINALNDFRFAFITLVGIISPCWRGEQSWQRERWTPPPSWPRWRCLAKRRTPRQREAVPPESPSREPAEKWNNRQILNRPKGPKTAGFCFQEKAGTYAVTQLHYVFVQNLLWKTKTKMIQININSFFVVSGNNVRELNSF